MRSRRLPALSKIWAVTEWLPMGGLQYDAREIRLARGFGMEDLLSGLGDRGRYHAKLI